MGSVYLARDLSLDRNVAMKFFTLRRLDEEPAGIVRAFKQRFIREARIAALINHPNVVQIYHAALEVEHPHFVMEYLEGETLEEVMESELELSLGQICYFGMQISHALRFAWETYSVIHRDLKPSNIMVLEDDRVKLLDLGIAKMVDASQAATQLTSIGMKVGSPYYMAPEQLVGAPGLDHRCDIYALGMLLCRLITGRDLYAGTTDYELHESKLAGLPFRIEREAPDTPETLVHLIYRMLEPDREERIESYYEIEDVLSDCLDELPDAPERWRHLPSMSPGTNSTDSEATPAEDEANGPTPESDRSAITRLSLATSPPEVEAEFDDGIARTPSGIIIEEVPVFLPQMRQLLDQIEPGMMLGEYQVMELIGFGGMGAVFRGIHLPNNEQVALKFLIGDDKDSVDDRLERFRLEAQIISRLKHPSIVRVRELQSLGGLYFMVMDLFLGLYGRPVNLRDYCHSFGTANGLLDEEDLQQISLALLEAIAYAHDKDVVHCDLKPENVLFQCVGFDEDGFWDAHLKLTDFGLAKIVGEELVLNSATRSMRSFAGHDDAPQDAAALIGTYDYMSPEQRRGEPATPASDLFAIGMMMLRLLTGMHELGLRSKPSKVCPGIAKDWDDIIITALRENPANRFADAHDMMQAIANIELV